MIVVVLMRRLLLTLCTLLICPSASSMLLIPGNMQWCGYWRSLGMLANHPECSAPLITTTTPMPSTNPPTTFYIPPPLATCTSNSALIQCSSDPFNCPSSGTVCIMSDQNRCCQGSNPGISVSDINAKPGTCPQPLGITTTQDTTVGCWLDTNCPAIQKCCVEPNAVTNSATRICRDPIGVSGTAICNLPLATGSCNTPAIRYYYDSTTGQCRSFQFSGCGGNSNNFQSLSTCQSTCGGIGITGSSACPPDANVGINCLYAHANACNTDADCLGRENSIQPSCCVTTCGYKICYQY